MNVEIGNEFSIKSLGIQERWVYDIEVEDNHNFFANDILVHNSGYLDFSKIVEKYQKGKTDAEITEFLNQVCIKDIEPFLVKIFGELATYTNAFQQKMHMKREAISSKGIWTGKKHYILNVMDLEGVRYDEPKLKIVGIEAVKSSTPSICRDKIKEAIKIIMNGDNEQLLDFNERFRSEFRKMRFEEIAFPRGLNKMNEYYDSVNGWKSKTPIHLRGAYVFNTLLDKRKINKKYPKLQSGDKIKFCYLREPNPTGTNVLSCLDEIPNELDDVREFIDYETQFQKAYLKPLLGITEVIGWEVEYKDSLF